MTALLAVEGLTKRFAGLLAVDQVSFELAAGEIFAVIGPNGAGKTTLFAMIAGAITPDEGTVWFDGVRVDRLTPDAVCRRGIGRTFQIVRPFPALSLRTMWRSARLCAAPIWRRPAPIARDILAALDLADKRTLPAASLTLPDRKRLEVARALATGPKLLLLDEVMAGLRPGRPTAWSQFCASSTVAPASTILLIEHVMRAVMALAGRVLVLHHGKTIAEGTPAAVVRDPAVIASYLGAEAMG